MERITEGESAAFVVTSIAKDVERAWPEISRTLNSFYRDKFVIEDEHGATFDLFLAMFAFEFGALKNLFSAEQSARLFSFGIAFLPADTLDYACQEIALYDKAVEAALETNENPMFAIPARLVRQWLGEASAVEILGEKYIDPLLIELVTDLLFRHVGLGRWKRIKEDFDIVRE